uniref:Sulfotransferase domain-containing protein n=1 Tax=viral metagenome TaxID=1070528 RepID=A0A6C0KSI8_9ZZZZ
MKCILILGMPRSGTSLVSQIVEKMGLDFGLNAETSIDTMYRNTTHTSFYQNKKLHLHLLSSFITDFSQRRISEFNEELLNVQVVKEPYLVGILDSIRHLIDKIILVVRNPNDVLTSVNKFYKDNSSDEKLTLKSWTQYYTTFVHSVGNIPYEVVNYDLLLKCPEKILKNISSFLGMENKDVNIKFNEKKPSTLLNLDASMMFLYKNLTEKMSIDMLKKELKCVKDENNAVCFCGSGRKYKKCCRLYNP